MNQPNPIKDKSISTSLDTYLSVNQLVKYMKENRMQPRTRVALEKLVKGLPSQPSPRHNTGPTYKLADVLQAREKWEEQYREVRGIVGGVANHDDMEEDTNNPALIELKKVALKKKIEILDEDLYSKRLENQQSKDKLVDSTEVTSYLTHLQVSVASKLKTILLNELPIELAGKDTAGIRQINETKVNLVLDMFRESLEQWNENHKIIAS